METIYRIAVCFWDKIRNWMKEEKNQRRFVVVCFVLSLVPLLILSFYNHPAMDDFNFGILTRRAWVANKGLAAIPAVLAAAVERSVYIWNVWQGTFSFSVLAALRPSIITEKLTFINTFILLGLFVWGFTKFSQVILHRILGLSRDVAVITACVVMTLCIQYVPYGVEAFYWWNGSIGYTGLFSVLLVMFSLLFLSKQERRISAKRMAALLFLAVLLSGGQFPVMLLGVVVLALCLVDVMIGKQYPKMMKLQMTGLTILYLAGLALSVAAPGNKRRQRYFVPNKPFKAIYRSYLEALAYMREKTNVIILLVMIGLFLWMFWKLKMTTFAFHCPLVFTLVTYSMYVVMWVPGMYAVKYISGGRYYNILYYGIVMFYAANVIYYAGWLRRQYEKCSQKFMGLVRGATPVLLGSMGVFCMALFLCRVDIVADLEEINTATALKSLVYGEARVYHEEIKAREALYNDPDIKVVEVGDLTYKPKLLFYGTLTTNPEDSRNQAMCNYYNKEYMVKLGEEE